ncbi:MAG: hypothetical protein IT384_15970 [Deltaproteobacteria bacterium]|nr:hypothetical protein [Deltaproteobacteria bacterium]
MGFLVPALTISLSASMAADPARPPAPQLVTDGSAAVAVSTPASAARLGLGAAGVAAAVVGVALIATAVAAPGAVRPACFPSPGSSCGPVEFLRFGYTTEAEVRSSAFAATANGRGPMIAPLGYSLLLTGATWLTGAILSDTDELPFWVSIPAGLAAGGLAYGLTEALGE